MDGQITCCAACLICLSIALSAMIYSCAGAWQIHKHRLAARAERIAASKATQEHMQLMLNTALRLEVQRRTIYPPRT